VDGFIDDFTSETSYLEKPVLRTEEIPQGCMVVSAVALGRPQTVQRKLDAAAVRSLDYFAFRKYSGIELPQPIFEESFDVEFRQNRRRYDEVYRLLADDESRHTMASIVNFRLSENLDFMRGFADIQYRQYFEEFLQLRESLETFLDVGCFDGYTTIEFVKRCPGYRAIHIFEPEPNNLRTVKSRLAECRDVFFHDFGLSSRDQALRFRSQGSASRVCEDGDIEIRLRKLDDSINDPFTFLKMDIEGEEISALEGARESIIRHHPRLAISAYHRCDDLWRIPELILSYRNDYRVYIRHYTEGVTETVMFFMPTG